MLHASVGASCLVPFDTGKAGVQVRSKQDRTGGEGQDRTADDSRGEDRTGQDGTGGEGQDRPADDS